MSDIGTDWAAFISAEGETFPADLRALYEAALPCLPGLWDRYLATRLPERRNVTLCHTDCYFNAFLCPRDPGGTTYIIDWQGPMVEFAARDLNFLFANFWTSAQRREGQREERLLRRYHRALLDHGVACYTWEELLLDYRLMLILSSLPPGLGCGAWFVSRLLVAQTPVSHRRLSRLALRRATGVLSQEPPESAVRCEWGYLTPRPRRPEGTRILSVATPAWRGGDSQ